MAVVERRGVFIAFLLASLACSCLAVFLTALRPETRSTGTAALMGLLAALAVFLGVVAYRHPEIRYPLALRLLLVAIAIKQGFDVAWASTILADRYQEPAWLALTALASAGVVLGVAHVVLYRSPPKPEPDTRTFKWPAKAPPS